MNDAMTPARRVNVIGVVLSVVFLAVASVGIGGYAGWLFDEAAKWIIAGVIALIGLGLLFGSGSSRSSRSTDRRP